MTWIVCQSIDVAETRPGHRTVIPGLDLATRCVRQIGRELTVFRHLCHAGTARFRPRRCMVIAKVVGGPRNKSGGAEPQA